MLSTSQRATRTGIAVPVPGAADAATGLEHPRRKAEPAQAVQHVHSGKARADDDGVENRPDFSRAWTSGCGIGSHGSGRFPGLHRRDTQRITGGF
jgi:hypothetical protein